MPIYGKQEGDDKKAVLNYMTLSCKYSVVFNTLLACPVGMELLDATQTFLLLSKSLNKI